jgi:hypothetical protein
MDDLTAPRIEPLGQSTDHEAYPPRKRPATKRETPEKSSPLPPLIESDDKIEDIHQIDELA